MKNADIKVRTLTNNAKLISLVNEKPGITKLELMEIMGLTLVQLNCCLCRTREDVMVVLIGSGRKRLGTYYIRDDDNMYDYKTLEPTIPGARIVHAGALIRAKYNEKSPELRKAESRGIQSCMGGTIYD
jgi:hypothetical protein